MLSRRSFAAGAGAAAGGPAILAGAARGQNPAAQSTIDRIQHAKLLRIAALPGEGTLFQQRHRDRGMVGDVRRNGEGHRRGFRRQG